MFQLKYVKVFYSSYAFDSLFLCLSPPWRDSSQIYRWDSLRRISAGTKWEESRSNKKVFESLYDKCAAKEKNNLNFVLFLSFRLRSSAFLAIQHSFYECVRLNTTGSSSSIYVGDTDTHTHTASFVRAQKFARVDLSNGNVNRRQCVLRIQFIAYNNNATDETD